MSETKSKAYVGGLIVGYLGMAVWEAITSPFRNRRKSECQYKDCKRTDTSTVSYYGRDCVVCHLHALVLSN